MRACLYPLVAIVCLAVCYSEYGLSQTPVAASCPPFGVEPQQFNAEEQQLICGAAADARAFFRSYGIDIKHAVSIQADDRKHDPVLPHIGAYSKTRESIRIRRIAWVRQSHLKSTLFGLPLNEALYRSVIVHEIAHAIAGQNFASPKPSLVAQEYLAYVTQLATMEPATRATILDKHKLAPYRDVDEMSSIYYAMSPNGFGIKAYRHFLALEDPGRFIRGLLSGAINPRDSQDQLP